LSGCTDSAAAASALFSGYKTQNGRILVPLYSRGPGADLFAHFIAGNDTIRGDYVDNTDVYTVMDMVLGVSDGCLGDFDSDGDVDGSDLAFFAADGDVAVFAADFGRTDCPCLSLTAESKPTFY
jgi:hypothetical protein